MSQTNPLESLFQEELYILPSPLLIILSKPWGELTAEELNTLTRMLNAVKLSLASVQIIIRKEFTLEELSAYSPERILAFGSSLKESSALYENLSIGGISVIISESLSQLDDTKKKNLWIALKKMFSL
ncbi:MAG: hypothetical protein ABI663_15785 [Chryseolinea sp.]